MSERKLRLDVSLLRPGMRLGVGVSGGADSVALLLALAERAGELGLVLHVAHLHHGLRGAEADADLEFVRELAGRLGVPFHAKRVDTAEEAARCGETIEEAARRLRYGWFRELMSAPEIAEGQSVLDNEDVAAEACSLRGASGAVDAVATAHTLDDQAETVLAKVLRGAWTEGIGGIHPLVEFPEGWIIRPMLATRRAGVEAYLKAMGQGWREDSSNRHLTFTRNRIRHELLPVLEGWNPKLREHLAQMAELGRDEESWWEAEVARVAPQVMLTGRPVRGGGRAAAAGVALDIGKLAELGVALQRRLVRFAAQGIGVAIDFAGTEALRELALQGRAGQRCELAAGLRAERSHRELRLSIQGAVAAAEGVPMQVEVPVPGEVEALQFGLRVRIEVEASGAEARLVPGDEAGDKARAPVIEQAKTAACADGTGDSGAAAEARTLGRPALLRAWKAGDRVHLRHSSGPRKVKEVLERMKVSGAERARWPVVEWNGRIVWMQGVLVEPERGLSIAVAQIALGE